MDNRARKIGYVYARRAKQPTKHERPHFLKGRTRHDLDQFADGVVTAGALHVSHDAAACHTRSVAADFRGKLERHVHEVGEYEAVVGRKRNKTHFHGNVHPIADTTMKRGF
jgi:hypothetical protein